MAAVIFIITVKCVSFFDSFLAFFDNNGAKINNKRMYLAYRKKEAPENRKRKNEKTSKGHIE